MRTILNAETVTQSVYDLFPELRRCKEEAKLVQDN